MWRLLCSAAILLVACTPAATPSPDPGRSVTYQYIAEFPKGPFAPGEVVQVDWVPKQSSTTGSDAYEVELCLGFFGPWDSVEALKSQSQPMAKPACPPVGAKAAVETERTRSNTGARLTTHVIAPSAPGFYDVRQIVLTGGDATVAGSIVEVRAR